MTEQDKTRCTCGAPPDSIHEPICDLMHPDGFEGIERGSYVSAEEWQRIQKQEQDLARKLETLREHTKAEETRSLLREADSMLSWIEARLNIPWSASEGELNRNDLNSLIGRIRAHNARLAAPDTAACQHPQRITWSVREPTSTKDWHWGYLTWCKRCGHVATESFAGSPTAPAPDTTAEAGEWRFHMDDYSEHYEVTNTNRARAEIGDGHLFRMGDKDDAERLVTLLNAITGRLREAEEQARLALMNEAQWRENAMARLNRAEAAEARAAAAEQRAERLEQALRSLETVTRSHARHGAGLEPGYDCDDLIAYCDVAAAVLEEDA